MIKNFLLIASMLASYKSMARIIYYGDAQEIITVAYGGPTIFRFDENVKTISQASRFRIEPADKDNPNYSMLSVTPRFTKGSNKVTFILANGALINTKIVTVPKNLPEKSDSFYDFRPKDQLLDQSTSSPEGEKVSELELMKSMIRWEKVLGYKSRNLVRTVNTGIPSLEAKLVTVYTGPKFNGYVFKIKNTSSSKNYAIDLRSLSLGKVNLAILSQVDRKILYPKGKGANVTFLRIVSKPSAVYYSIKLPVSSVKLKKNK